MATHTGGCACGAVRFKIEEDPITARVCWCRGCQYLGAGSGTVGVMFPTATFAFTSAGEMGDFASTADSGSAMHRRFCAKCGTPLFSEAESRPHAITIRAGAMDHPENYPPRSIIWAKAAPPWATFDPALPTVDGQPPPPPKP